MADPTLNYVPCADAHGGHRMAYWQWGAADAAHTVNATNFRQHMLRAHSLRRCRHQNAFALQKEGAAQSTHDAPPIINFDILQPNTRAAACVMAFWPALM